VEIDTTGMTIAQVGEKICNLCEELC